MPGKAKPALDAVAVRKEFPLLARRTRGKRLVYLDSAAMAQKPRPVLDAMRSFYEECCANVHRAVYGLSAEATERYEGARQSVARLINARPDEVVFTRNATEGLNLAAGTLGASRAKPDSTILLTEMEHHSNLVPWQQLAKRMRARLAFVPVTKDGLLDLAAAERLLAGKPAVFAFTAASNLLGTITPVRELVAMARKHGVPTVVDAAQAVPHLPVDVQAWGADMVAFSGQKMLGPGVGVLWARRELLAGLPPFLTGGHMVKKVTYQDAQWDDGPGKYEAGTQDIAGVIGLGAAAEYLLATGMKRVRQHEDSLVRYALKKLPKVPGLTVYGPKDPALRCGVISFNLGDVHPHDLASVLDELGICVRSGHHCCQPLTDKLTELGATCRASFGVYTGTDDIDALVAALQKARGVFRL
jgi:cysteine desulfurase/selenocysteine lyase